MWTVFLAADAVGAGLRLVGAGAVAAAGAAVRQRQGDAYAIRGGGFHSGGGGMPRRQLLLAGHGD